jgi:hypothetical protein
VFGWVGLLVLMTSTEPELGPRWLFFFLLVIAFTGVGLPFAVILNHRFPSNPPAPPQTVVRQGLWVGVFAATVAWLLVGGVFSFGLAAIFIVGFGGIEVFLRLRELSLWRKS